MKDKQTGDNQPIKLATVNTQLESDMLLALLEDNGIPAYRQHQGSGGYMAIYMNYSVFGSDIYVNAADYAKAKELLDLLEVAEAPEGSGGCRLSAADEAKYNVISSDDDDENNNSGEPLSKKDDPRYRFCIFFIRLLLVFILGSIVMAAVSALKMFFSLL